MPTFFEAFGKNGIDYGGTNDTVDPQTKCANFQGKARVYRQRRRGNYQNGPTMLLKTKGRSFGTLPPRRGTGFAGPRAGARAGATTF